jgi:membrane associated rhomboid family serine protease
MTQPPVASLCYRHPDRPTYIACQRCGRPICADCMINASVGFQCPECVHQGAKQTRQAQLPFGGSRLANPNVTTFTLIGINIAVWATIMLTGGSSSSLVNVLALSPAGRCLSLADASGWYPSAGQTACSLLADGSWQPGVATGAFWQLLTTAFTHVEFFHILVNMVSLYFLGPLLEQVLGRVRFLAIYLISALAGSASVMLFADSNSLTLGASGAIFGLIGALLAVAYKVRGDVRTILMWLGINLVITFVPSSNISWQGHVGGLIGGLITAAVIVWAPRANRNAVQFLGLAATTAVIAGLIVFRMLQLT